VKITELIEQSLQKMDVTDRRTRIYRWLEAAEQAKKILSEAAMTTIIADRESAIYEEWARIPDAKNHLLTRVCRDGALAESDFFRVQLIEGQNLQNILNYTKLISLTPRIYQCGICYSLIS
jgi:hypothetical protein